MEKRIQCFMIHPTGRMTGFLDGLSSPVFIREDNQQLVHIGWDDRYPSIRMAGPGAIRLSPDYGMIIRTPGGDWYIDRQSSSGGRWTRTGEPPCITARPSILFGSVEWADEDGKIHRPTNQRPYHAWLNGGWLEEI